MILLLLQPTNHHNAHRPLDPLHPQRKPAPVDCVHARALPQHELLRKRALVPAKLVVHPPGAVAPPLHRGALARHPRVVVGCGAGVRDGVEEELAVGEGDVYDGGRDEFEEPGAQPGAEFPGVGGGEVREGERGFERGDLFKGAWGLGQVGHCLEGVEGRGMVCLGLACTIRGELGYKKSRCCLIEEMSQSNVLPCGQRHRSWCLGRIGQMVTVPQPTAITARTCRSLLRFPLHEDSSMIRCGDAAW